MAIIDFFFSLQALSGGNTLPGPPLEISMGSEDYFMGDETILMGQE